MKRRSLWCGSARVRPRMRRTIFKLNNNNNCFVEFPFRFNFGAHSLAAISAWMCVVFIRKTVGDATPVVQTVCAVCVPHQLNEIERYENRCVALASNDDLPIKNGVRVDFRFALCSDTQNKNIARNWKYFLQLMALMAFAQTKLSPSASPSHQLEHKLAMGDHSIIIKCNFIVSSCSLRSKCNA